MNKYNLARSEFQILKREKKEEKAILICTQKLAGTASLI